MVGQRPRVVLLECRRQRFVVQLDHSDVAVCGGAAQQLFTVFAGTTFGVAPDGQHFLVESIQSGAVMVTVTNWFDELRRRAPQEIDSLAVGSRGAYFGCR